MAVEELGIEFVASGFSALEGALKDIETDTQSTADAMVDLASGADEVDAALAGVRQQFANAGEALEELASSSSEADDEVEELGDEVEDTGEKSKGLADIVKVALGVALADLATGALAMATNAFNSLVGQIGDCMDEAMESERAVKSLEQTIKSTGGAAGLTSERAQELAVQFRDLYGGSDEAALAIEDIGLTMGTISADEMPKFLQNVADLGAKMGSTEQAARLMAQAQEDPVSVLTRLRRMGILFSESLEQQIKDQAKAGDTAGAYALVMGRVEEATGGAAKAMAETASGKMPIMQTRLGDIKETLGNALLPVLVSVGDTLLATFDDPAVQGAIGSVATALGNVGTHAMAAFKDAGPMLKSLGASIMPVLNEVFKKFGDWWSENGPNVSKLISIIGERLQQLAGFVLTMWEIVRPIFEALADIILNLTDFVLSVAVGDWESAWDAIQKIVGAAWEGIQGLFSNLAAWVTGWFGTSWQAVVDMWRGNFDMMAQVTELIWGKIKKSFSDAVSSMTGFMTGLWNSVKETWDKITKTISDALGGTQKSIDSTTAGISDGWKSTWDSINDTVTDVLTIIDTFIKDTISTLFEWLGLNEDEMYRKWSDILEGMRLIATEVWRRISEWITTTMGNIVSTISTKIGEAKTTLETAWNSMVATATARAGEIYTSVTGKIAEIGTWITAQWETIKGWGSGIMTAISDGIRDAAGKIGDAVSDAVNSINMTVGPVFEKIKSIGSDIIKGIGEGIAYAWTGLSTALTGVFDNVGASLAKAGSAIYDALISIGSGIIDIIMDGIRESAGGFIDFITGIIEQAIRDILARLGIPWPGGGGDDDGEDGIESVAGEMTGDYINSLLVFTSQIYDSVKGTNVLLAGIYGEMQKQVEYSSGGAAQTVNNYYSTSRTNNLTTQSMVRTGGLALEFATMDMVTR